jgi:hypothetical protein
MTWRDDIKEAELKAADPTVVCVYRVTLLTDVGGRFYPEDVHGLIPYTAGDIEVTDPSQFARLVAKATGRTGSNTTPHGYLEEWELPRAGDHFLFDLTAFKWQGRPAKNCNTSNKEWNFGGFYDGWVVWRDPKKDRPRQPVPGGDPQQPRATPQPAPPAESPPAPAPAPADGPTDGRTGMRWTSPQLGVALIGVLVALLAGWWFVTGRQASAPTSQSINETPATSEAASASARASTSSPGSSLATANGITVGNGLPLTGTAVVPSAQGGCPGFAAPATSPFTLEVVNGRLALELGSYASQSLDGTVGPNGAFTATSPDGSIRVQGIVGPTQISGTIQITRGECTETLVFTALLAPIPTPPQFVLIATNAITFGQATTFDPAKTCREGGTVTFTWKIVGISPNTPVAAQLTGPGVTSPLTFVASSDVPVTRSFHFPPGGGSWSDTIVTIGGKPPPSSGAHVSTVVQCVP